MRLIDANALNDEMYHKSFEVDDGRNVWNSGLWIRYKIFEEAIRDAPTVDAIPIEWIEETMRLAESVGAKEYAEHLEVLMADWAEEMEDVYVTLHHDDINFKDEESEKAFYEALEREEE